MPHLVHVPVRDDREHAGGEGAAHEAELDHVVVALHNAGGEQLQLTRRGHMWTHCGVLLFFMQYLRSKEGQCCQSHEGKLIMQYSHRVLQQGHLDYEKAKRVQIQLFHRAAPPVRQAAAVICKRSTADRLLNA